MPPKKLSPKAPASASPQQKPAPTPAQKSAPKLAQKPAQKPARKPAPKLGQKPDQKPPPPKLSSQSTSKKSTGAASGRNSSQPAIPEAEVKKSSSTSAQLALQAGKKAYELRQAAHGAADPDAREEILAKAINKEIEAESFGKAAKYTRSGAFQGLAAGAGLGVQPGVALGKVTGAIVGGLISSVGALLGGGAGSVYGSISGPFWDLGEMASQGVRSIVGDFPNYKASAGQKQALDKMLLGAQQTEAPSQEELHQMSKDDGGANMEDYKQFASDLTSWLPSKDSLPSMPTKESVPAIPAMSSFTGQGGGQAKQSPSSAAGTTTRKHPASSNQKKPPAKKPKKLEVKSKT